MRSAVQARRDPASGGLGAENSTSGSGEGENKARKWEKFKKYWEYMCITD